MYFEFCILGLMEMFLKLMDNVLAEYFQCIINFTAAITYSLQCHMILQKSF